MKDFKWHPAGRRDAAFMPTKHYRLALPCTPWHSLFYIFFITRIARRMARMATGMVRIKATISTGILSMTGSISLS